MAFEVRDQRSLPGALLLLLLLPALFLKGNMVRTVCNGAWEDSAVWEGGTPPGPGDSILVRHKVKNLDPILLDQNHVRIKEKAALCGYHPVEIPSGSSLSNFGFLGVSSMELQDSLINYGELVSDSAVSITGYLKNEGGSITVGTFSCFDKPTCTPAIVAIQGDSIASNTAGDSYRWSLDGNSLADTGRRIPLQGSGTYRVRILHASGDSSAHSPPYEHSASGTASPSVDKGHRLTVRPNPSSGPFILQTSSPDPYGRYQVLDLRGRRLRTGSIEKERMRIDLSVYGSGIYWIRVEGPEGTLTRQVVVQGR